jgi:alkylhydroperoxidase family enzyme
LARHLAGGAEPDPDERLLSLLTIAEKVRLDGRSVTSKDISRARAAGADDHAIHETVLIAAAFAMFNR